MFWRLACLLGALGLTFGAAALVASGSAADDLYSVRDIAVDVSDVSAVEARRKALREAQMLGAHRLLRRLTRQEEWERLPRLRFDEIRPLISSLEIESEKTSSTRYLAQVTINFSPQGIQELLTGEDIRFLEFSPLTSLVLPLYHDRIGWLLWDKPNPWWQAWSDLDAALLANRYLLPLADLEDRLALPTASLAAGEDALLARVAARYELDRILLARAFAPAEEGEDIRTRVSLYRIMPGESGVERLGSFTFEAANLDAAATHIAARMEREWKERNIQERTIPDLFRLRARFADLFEWNRMLREMETARYIRSLRVESLDVSGAWVRLGFNGSGAMLIDALQRSGLRVTREGEDWVLRLARVASADTAPAADGEAEETGASEQEGGAEADGAL